MLGLCSLVEKDESDRIFMQIAIFNQHFWITIRVRVIRDIRDIRVRVRVIISYVLMMTFNIWAFFRVLTAVNKRNNFFNQFYRLIR